MNSKFLTITQAAQFLKVSPDTLRRWEEKGIVTPARTKGGNRRYTLLDLKIARLNKRKREQVLSNRNRFFQIPTLLRQNYINSRQDLKIAILTSFLWIFALIAYNLLTPVFLRPTNPEYQIVSAQLKEQTRLNLASETTQDEANFLTGPTNAVIIPGPARTGEKITPPTAGSDLLIGHSLPALEYSNVINQYYSLQPLPTGRQVLPKNESPTLIIKKVDPLVYLLI